MVTPVGNKPILAIIPTRAVSQLKGVSSIDSFTFGKHNLRPAIVELFKRQGIEIKDIYLDNPAKVRLMGMMPSFESLVAEGKTVEEIFTKLELSVFSKEAEDSPQTLYILGNQENISSLTIDQKQLNNSIYEMFGKLVAYKSDNFPNYDPLATFEIQPLVEIKEFFQKYQNPESVEFGLVLVFRPPLESKNAVWAGLMLLDVIPIPDNHPLLLRIADHLADVIGFGKYLDNVGAAARKVIYLNILLPAVKKAAIISAAERQIEEILSDEAERASERGAKTLALLKTLIEQFKKAEATPSPPSSPAAPTIEISSATVKEADKPDLDQQFPLTIFNDKTQRREVILLSLKQVLAKLPQVVKLLEDLLTKSKDWECVIVAAETAIRLKDILSASDKLALKTAANNLLLEIAVEEVFSDDEVSPAPEKAENALSYLIEIMDK